VTGHGERIAEFIESLKEAWIWACIVALCLAVGFGLGRATAPKETVFIECGVDMSDVMFVPALFWPMWIVVMWLPRLFHRWILPEEK